MAENQATNLPYDHHVAESSESIRLAVLTDSTENDSEECDDPSDSLTIAEVDSKVIVDIAISPSLSPPSREETDSDNIFSETKQREEIDEDEDLHQKWNASLYMLQSQAPLPKCIQVKSKVEDCPPQYGIEYHGCLNRVETNKLLGTEDGSYLVRQNVTGTTVLSLRMTDRVYNYRLFYEDGLYYVGENRFEILKDLVQDGLITLYLQHHNVAETMHEGQMQSLLRRKVTEKKLKYLKRAPGRRVKGLKGKKAWEYHRTISDTSLTSVRSPSPTPSPTNSATNSPTVSPVHSPLCPRLHIPRANLATQRKTDATNNDESNLDFKSDRRSTPNLHAVITLNGERRTNSASSLHTPSAETNRYSTIISTLRNAVMDDKKKEVLKLDNSSFKLKTCSSDGKIGKLRTSIEDKTENGNPFPYRAHSCHVPFATPLERITDLSVKGTNSLSRSSMTALAKHTSGPKSPYYKAHNFVVHTYHGPTWCEICHHFLWGLKHQGMQCKDCGMDIHKQCVPLALQLECYPNKQCVKRVYGVDLTTLVKLEGGVIPQILDDLFTEIQSRDLTIEGIYRVSGQTSEVIFLKEKYDEGDDVDLSQYLDVSVLTGAVKLFLRELPIPLITFDTYKDIMKATVLVCDPDNSNTDGQHLISALKLLPKAHHTTLHHLAQHLYSIHSLSAENKMTAQNLSVVFAPTLMRSPNDNFSLIRDLLIQRNFIEYFILNYDTVFR